MKAFKFNALLQDEGWIKDAVVSVNEEGLITAISQRVVDGAEVVNGYAVPGFQNAHSHAFQYAMAGTAERHITPPGDDFWSWREAMYKLALAIEPQQLEHIAAMLFSEMVRHGYTHVAEFHYLHHDKSGNMYANVSEHGERLVAAAKQAGIKITLMPMFYQKGGFDTEPTTRQRRFISPTTEAYLKLLEASQNSVRFYKGARLGFGVHSLRAVQSSDILRTINEGPKGLPFHIHIAEQLKEVDEALQYLKKRPVEWLLEKVAVDHTFHLVHATHVLPDEVSGIAQSGAQVVLCPSTEGNLGDGIFPLRDFKKHGGKWSIGTDSHIGLNPLEELRLLDYGQRLISHKRNTFITEENNDSGKYSFKQALVAGRRAMGNSVESYFKLGEPLDVVVYDALAPLLASSSEDNLLSTIIYAGDASHTLGTIINGQWITKQGMHLDYDDISRNFLKTMKTLGFR